MLKILKFTSLIIAMAISNFAKADLVIIGNTNYSGGQLDSSSVQKIFLGKSQSFPNGNKATPANHAVGSPDRKEFFDSVLAMGESSHKRHWRKMLSTGKGVSPTELNNYKEVLRWVAENPNGIAYIDSRAVNDSVKVLLTIEDYSGFSNTEVSENDLSGSENI